MNCLLLNSSHTGVSVYNTHYKCSLFINTCGDCTQTDFSTPQPSKCHITQGLIGIISLISGPYLIFVDECKYIGQLFSTRIFVLKRVKIVSLQNRILSREQEADEKKFLEMLYYILEHGHFYFAELQGQVENKYDLTKRLQDTQRDPQFIWNYDLIPPKLQNPNAFFVHLIQGFVRIETCSLNKIQFDFALVSRRSKFRAGTKFNKRGIDRDGRVANFVETEMIVVFEDQLAQSYLQIRGSVPLIWKQKANLNYDPYPDFSELQSNESQKACKTYLSRQVKKYGELLLIDLLKHRGYENILSTSYEKQIKLLNLEKVNYISFDIDKICGHRRYEKLILLKEQVDEYLKRFGYYENNTPQRGVFSINCKDSLDRTNLVQTYFAKHVLELLLRKRKILLQEEKIEDHREFDECFRNAWTDNGNALSLFYAGSGAMRSGVTRTGKATRFGRLQVII